MLNLAVPITIRIAETPVRKSLKNFKTHPDLGLATLRRRRIWIAMTGFRAGGELDEKK